ncbi:unnamed protein product [Caenorhabditis sp. 36 PRJEB53466]|nr:unnamed protein product [Caenorhabditis sp. 36 PRJEB53466]
MGDEPSEVNASAKNESFDETDSFDEPKGVPISLEPVFSTAGGVRIDVDPEALEKSRRLLSSDSRKPSKSSFSSPLIKMKANGDGAGSSRPFISPFRRDEQSSSTKRPASNAGNQEETGAPPAKKSTIPPLRDRKSSGKTERKEIHADVLRVAKIAEKDQIRMILQESHHASLILATCSTRRGSDIKYGDRIHVDAQILKKNDSDAISEVYVEKVIKHKKNGASSGIRRHSIAKKPFCLPPKFIHELTADVKKAVLHVHILDMKIQIYDGCSNCKFLWENEKTHKTCTNCKSSRVKVEPQIFCKVRKEWRGGGGNVEKIE